MDELQNNSDPASRPAPAPAFAAATQPPYIRTLFLGPEGLRPGWGLASYAVMFYLLQRLVGVFAESLNLGSLRTMAVEEFASFMAAVVPAIIMSKIERRTWGTYGLPLRPTFGSLFTAGSVWGFAGISLLMVALYGLHAFYFGHIVLHGPKIAKFAAFWAVMFLLVGLFEEFLLRGYTQFTLTRAIGFWPAALVLSAAFGLIHIRNAGEAWAGVLAAAWIGLFFCLTLRRTGNLWFAVGFHAAWDWGETFFYSVPDSGTVFPGHLLSSSLHGAPWLSGGSVGPEGSALCFVIVALLAAAFHRVYPQAKYFPERGPTARIAAGTGRDLPASGSATP